MASAADIIAAQRLLLDEQKWKLHDYADPKNFEVQDFYNGCISVYKKKNPTFNLDRKFYVLPFNSSNEKLNRLVNAIPEVMAQAGYRDFKSEGFMVGQKTDKGLMVALVLSEEIMTTLRSKLRGTGLGGAPENN